MTIMLLVIQYNLTTKRKKDKYNLNLYLIMQVLVVGDKVIPEGEWISLNGSTGEVILGKQPLSPPALSDDLATFMSWADEIRHLKVRAYYALPASLVVLNQIIKILFSEYSLTLLLSIR